MAGAWLSLLEIDFDGVTKRYCEDGVAGPSAYYEPMIVEGGFGSFTRTVPLRPGLPSISNLTVRLSNATLEFSQLMAQYQFRGRTVRVKIGQEGSLLSGFGTYFTGKIHSAALESNVCTILVRDSSSDKWKERIAGEILAAKFPNLPDSLLTTQGNIVFGYVTSVGKTDQGFVPCQLVDTVDHRYLVACHRVKCVEYVYVPSEHSAANFVVEYDSDDWTYVRFDRDVESTATPSGEFSVTADVQGLYAGLGLTNATNASPIVITTPMPHGLTTGDSVTVSGVLGNTAANGTSTVTVVTTTTFSLDGSTGNGAYTSGGDVTVGDGYLYVNPAEAMRAGLIRFGIHVIGDIDAASYSALQTAQKTAGYIISGCITTPDATWESIVEQFMMGFSFQVFFGAGGTLKWADYKVETATGSEPVITDDLIGNPILKTTFQVESNQDVVNKETLHFDYDPSVGTPLREPPELSNRLSITNVGTFAEDLPLLLVEDWKTAHTAACIRMYYSDEDHQLVAFELSAPLVPATVEIANLAAVTHYQGLSATKAGWTAKLVRVLALDYILNGTPKVRVLCQTMAAETNTYLFQNPPVNVTYGSTSESSATEGKVSVTWTVPGGSPAPNWVHGFYKRTTDKLSQVKYAGKALASAGVLKWLPVFDLSTSLDVYLVPEASTGVIRLLEWIADGTKQSTLAEAIDPTESGFDIADATNFAADDYVLCDREINRVKSKSVNTLILYGTAGGVSLTVTGATNPNPFIGPIVITTSGAHGLLTDDVVTISGVVGNTAANGTWRIIVLTSTTFSLNGSIANAAYASGGSVAGRNVYQDTVWDTHSLLDASGNPTTISVIKISVATGVHSARTAITTIADLTGSVSGSQVSLDWSDVSTTDSKMWREYEVWRGTTATYADSTKLADSATSSYTDTGFTSTGPFYYWITSVTRAGVRSVESNDVGPLSPSTGSVAGLHSRHDAFTATEAQAAFVLTVEADLAYPMFVYRNGAYSRITTHYTAATVANVTTVTILVAASADELIDVVYVPKNV